MTGPGGVVRRARPVFAWAVRLLWRLGPKLSVPVATFVGGWTERAAFGGRHGKGCG